MNPKDLLDQLFSDILEADPIEDGCYVVQGTLAVKLPFTDVGTEGMFNVNYNDGIIEHCDADTGEVLDKAALQLTVVPVLIAE